MNDDQTRNLKRTLTIAVLVAIFFSASWYFQRDKIDAIKKEKQAQQEEGNAKLAYQDCIRDNIENIEVCEPLKEVMDAQLKASFQGHTETVNT